MSKIVRILGIAAVLISSSRALAYSAIFYDCHLVIHTRDEDGGWTLEASPHEKFGPVPASPGTLKGEINFKNFFGQIEIMVASHQKGKVLIRVQRNAQMIPSSYAYTTLFTENVEAGMELNESELVRLICRKQ